MNKILLVQPPIRDFYLTAKRTIPYGLASIAAALINAGFSVEILDGLATRRSRTIGLPDEMAYLRPLYGGEDRSPFALFHQFRHFGYSFEHIKEQARKSGAFLVGISSLFTPYCAEALETATVIKAALPDCKIVLGGHHATALPESVISSNAVDYVLRGEGEVSMPLLALALKNGTSLKQIPGLVYQKPSGRINISNSACMDQPGKFPLPAVELVNQHFYKRKKRGSAVVVCSRGCPMRCSYCSMRRSEDLPYRRRSVDAVMAEIENAVEEYDVGFIDFEDENLSMDRPWFLKLLAEIHRRFGDIDLELRAMNGLFPPSLDEEVVQAMARSGFKTLNLSLGSTNIEQLKRFQRPDVRQAFENALKLAEANDLQAVGYIIVGGPDQMATDSINDLLYLAGKRVLAGVSVFYPSPGSPDFERCKQLGVLPETYSLMRSSALPISHTTTREESVTLLRLGRIVNFMKSLLDSGSTIPEARPLSQNKHLDIDNRMQVGRQLLKWFLHDGKIRGVRPEGKVFVHNTSDRVTQAFLRGMRKTRVIGYQ
jgi:radical SAM superfamily enzyme YgiQ (UPF0313 family)